VRALPTLVAFLLDTMGASDLRGRGVGTELVAVAAEGARTAGWQWLHVDFEERLRPFYFEACGFRPTDAGLIALR
jgi:N-acetylglutamate synthase-like GNAT family acetyltransferase